MWIHRDIEHLLKKNSQAPIQILLGPRQCGKSSLFSHLGQGTFHEVTLDDLQMRLLANRDPGLFMLQQTLPLIIDEIQYAPALFPELKKFVDQLKKRRLFTDKNLPADARLWLTGSNQILLDKNVRETLAGRASYYYLNTLSVSEIHRAFPQLPVTTLIFQGGWPELYQNSEIPVVQYLNDYNRTYIEKDVIHSAGITKHTEFYTVLGMLAARAGQLLNYSAIAKDSGVKSVTVQEWVSLLERAGIIALLPPYHDNLNKRLTKSPKLYFLDTGLATRLQGWIQPKPMLISPQAGHLFENLVFAEIIKCQQNYGKNWKIYLWRTKEGEEIDFIIENSQGNVLALDAKMGVHGIQPENLPAALKLSFPQISEIILVSVGGKKTYLTKHCLQLPITSLTDYLLDF